jgi:hypothetical protein
MKNLTTTLCLTIAVLLGSVGVSWSSDIKNAFLKVSENRVTTLYRSNHSNPSLRVRMATGCNKSITE